MFFIDPRLAENDSKKIREAYAALSLCFFIVLLLGLTMGEVRVSLLDLPRIFLPARAETDLYAFKRYAILHIRLPRILTAALCGGALAACGAVLQGVLSNDLASPFTVAASPGAAFGASCAALAALPFSVALPPVACACAVFLSWVGNEVFGSDRRGGLAASGILVGAVFWLASLALRSFAGMNFRDALALLLGNFSAAGWFALLSVSIGCCIFFLICSAYAQEIEILSSTAREGGLFSRAVSTRTHLILLFGVAVSLSPVSAAFGIFPLFGLAVPHLLRAALPRVGGHFLSLCILCGAIAMSAIDSVARTIKNPPAGVLVLLAGLPFFLLLLLSRKNIPRK